MDTTPGSSLPQVNAPKTTRTFCKSPKCRKHETFKITQYKAGKASIVAQGAPLQPSGTSALAVRASSCKQRGGRAPALWCQSLVQRWPNALCVPAERSGWTLGSSSPAIARISLLRASQSPSRLGQ